MEIRSVAKAVRLLEALGSATRPMGVSDLARRVDIDKSTVSRMLRTLEQSGLVAQDETSREYVLGLNLVHLGQKVLRRLDLREAARPALAALVQRTGECAHLAILCGNRALYVEQAAPQKGITVEAPIGTLAPLHCTALGKAILAFQYPQKQEELVSHLDLEGFTRRTLLDLGTLRSHLKQVYDAGIAYDDEEFSIGVRCAAAPVFGYDGKVAGAIGISGPSPRVTDDRLQDWTIFIRNQARDLSMKLGWQVDQVA